MVKAQVGSLTCYPKVDFINSDRKSQHHFILINQSLLFCFSLEQKWIFDNQSETKPMSQSNLQTTFSPTNSQTPTLFSNRFPSKSSWAWSLQVPVAKHSSSYFLFSKQTPSMTSTIYFRNLCPGC